MDQPNQNQPAEEQKPTTPETGAETPAQTPAAAEPTNAAVSPAPAEQKEQQPTPPAQTPEHSATDTPSVFHPTDGGNSNKPLMMIAGIIAAVALLAGSAWFVMSRTNESKQLGAIQKPRPTVTAEPMSPEEQAIENIDTGDPQKELEEIGDLYDGLE